jgi:hypothetical protein
MAAEYAEVSWTSHDVVRIADGKTIGVISAQWGDYILLKTQTFGNVPRGVLELFRWDFTPRATRAHGKYKFVPPLT